jgi:hypothetical protein
MSEEEKKNMVDYNEAIAMNPIEKYEKLGRFPYKMIVHILLVIFTTFQVVLIVGETNKISRSQERLFYNMFIDDSDKRSLDYDRMAYLFSVDDVKEHVRNSVNNFYSLNTKSLEIVKFTDENPFLLLQVDYIDDNEIENFSAQRDYGLQDSNSVIKKNYAIPRYFSYKLDNSTLGPFEYQHDEIKEFLNDVVDFKLNYTLKTYVPFYYNNNYDCNLWWITQIYNFANRGHFIVKLNIIKKACEDFNGNHSYLDIFVNKLLWIHIIVFILAVLSLIMTWNYIQSIASLYIRVKSKYKQKKLQENEDAYYSKSEDSIYYNPLLDEELRKLNKEETKKMKRHKNRSLDELSALDHHYKYSLNNNFNNNNNIFSNGNNFLSVNDQIKYLNNRHQTQDSNKSRYHFSYKKDDRTERLEKQKRLAFNSWSIICMAGNILQVFGSAISLFDTNNIMTSAEILVGFGCMLAFLNLGRYIEYSQNYAAIYVTLRKSLPKVMRYLIGVTPIFLGYIFLGLCIFWKSERFTDTSNVMIILFSLANGDSIYDAFKDLSGFHFLIGQIYLYSFCITFIVVVLNIFIAIIEEAYIISKMENKTHWVFDYIKNDKSQKNFAYAPPKEDSVLKKPEEKQSQSEKSISPSYRNREKEKRYYKSTNQTPKVRTPFAKDTSSSKRVSFLTKKNYIDDDPSSYYNKHKPKQYSQQDQFIPLDGEIDQQQYEKILEEEFEMIEKEIKDILQISLEIKMSNDDLYVEEMRILVLDHINSSIMSKTHEIRSILNKID